MLAKFDAHREYMAYLRTTVVCDDKIDTNMTFQLPIVVRQGTTPSPISPIRFTLAPEISPFTRDLNTMFGVPSTSVPVPDLRGPPQGPQGPPRPVKAVKSLNFDMMDGFMDDYMDMDDMDEDISSDDGDGNDNENQDQNQMSKKSRKSTKKRNAKKRSLLTREKVPLDSVTQWTERAESILKRLPAASSDAADRVLALLPQVDCSHIRGREWEFYSKEFFTETNFFKFTKKFNLSQKRWKKGIVSSCDAVVYCLLSHVNVPTQDWPCKTRAR